ncbi:MAG: hypothetical protein RIS94_3409 [Pseudomonadota bacterium]|jgi:predicted metal-dependent hydrolase
MTLKIRKPDIIRDEADLNWSPVPEFAHILNGASVVIPFVEHYLNAVMNDVRRNHCANHPALAQELDLFIEQETMHTRLHRAFNKRMFDAGYDGLKAVTDRATNDLQRMRRTRSLKFNVAYCAGFETTATFSAKYLLEQCDALFRDGDAFGANLLQWHVAEEFEHRTSCHRALEAIGGGYWLRLVGFAYSFWHINILFGQASNVIFGRYRAAMTPAQRRRSKRMVWKLKLRQLAHMLPGLIRLVTPGYDPARITLTPRIAQALDFYAQKGPIAINFADLPRPARTA